MADLRLWCRDIIDKILRDGDVFTTLAVRDCGHNCLKPCCIQDVKIPLRAFEEADKVTGKKDLDFYDPSLVFLDFLILGEWNDCMQRGLFHYDVAACGTDVIPGEYGFVAQLNGRRYLKKKPIEF